MDDFLDNMTKIIYIREKTIDYREFSESLDIDLIKNISIVDFEISITTTINLYGNYIKWKMK